MIAFLSNIFLRFFRGCHAASIMCGQTAALKREIFTGRFSCGPSAVLCGKQHYHYIDFYFPGQVQNARKAHKYKLFGVSRYWSQKFFFTICRGIPVYPHFHIVTIPISTICGNNVDNSLFWPIFIHYPPKLHVFRTKSGSGIIIKSIVIHNFINIFL